MRVPDRSADIAIQRTLTRGVFEEWVGGLCSLLEGNLGVPDVEFETPVLSREIGRYALSRCAEVLVRPVVVVDKAVEEQVVDVVVHIQLRFDGRVGGGLLRGGQTREGSTGGEQGIPCRGIALGSHRRTTGDAFLDEVRLTIAHVVVEPIAVDSLGQLIDAPVEAIEI